MSEGGRGVARRAARVLPYSARYGLKRLWAEAATARARQRWNAAEPCGALDPGALDHLVSRYPIAPCAYSYSAADVLARGDARATSLAQYVSPASSTLEIGSADAMTAGALAQRGHRAVAIDIDTSRTDARARRRGVDVITMDATRLGFAEHSFDLVYSFNSFEHLPDPAATFSETVRVLRPGGVGVISFAGLRWSPQGAHLYKAIGIPWVTVLFEADDVRAYLASRGLPTHGPWVNDYSIEQFRSSFRSQAPLIETVRYREARNCWHSDLLTRYAEVFKGRAPSFDSLIVDSVDFVFRKR